MSIEEYRQKRMVMLVELRILRRTDPAMRVIKHMQRMLRKLRTFRRMMEEAE